MRRPSLEWMEIDHVKYSVQRSRTSRSGPSPVHHFHAIAMQTLSVCPDAGQCLVPSSHHTRSTYPGGAARRDRTTELGEQSYVPTGVLLLVLCTTSCVRSIVAAVASSQGVLIAFPLLRVACVVTGKGRLTPWNAELDRASESPTTE